MSEQRAHQREKTSPRKGTGLTKWDVRKMALRQRPCGRTWPSPSQKFILSEKFFKL